MSQRRKVDYPRCIGALCWRGYEIPARHPADEDGYVLDSDGLYIGVCPDGDSWAACIVMGDVEAEGTGPSAAAALDAARLWLEREAERVLNFARRIGGVP